MLPICKIKALKRYGIHVTLSGAMTLAKGIHWSAITTLVIVTAAIYTASVSADPPDTAPDGRGNESKQNSGQASGKGGSAKASGNGITYHGGPVLTSGAHVFYIWYGNWSSNTATTILPALAMGLSGSPYFNIETTYYNGSNQKVQNAVSLAGQYMYTTGTTYSKSLSDANIQTIVAATINGGNLAYDASGVYFVLTSSDVKETSGFCTKYCGWHTYFNLNGVPSQVVKYSFVGNGDQCPSACEEQTASSPNGNTGADGMASVISHELDESTNDPQLNAWYDSKGNESADKCAWTFGTTKKATNGSLYNMTLGGLEFLIQQNWVNAGGGYCALSY